MEATRVSERLLLELPLPFLRADGRLLVESQAANGLRLWCRNFQHVTLCAPALPDRFSSDPTWRWVDPFEHIEGGSLQLVELPWAYQPWEFLRVKARMQRQLSALIDAHRYLVFSNLGGAGAWGTLAADVAHAKGRPYGVWLDCVLHEMPLDENRSMLRLLKQRMERVWIRRGSLRAIRHSDLGMFHGSTVYEAYKRYSRVPQLVHDVHLGPETLVSKDAVSERIGRVDRVFRIGYVGRVIKLKGPSDWIEAMRQLKSHLVQGELFEAVWLGDGTELDASRRRVEEAGLSAEVRFPGADTDRGSVLDFMRRLDAFVFCHLSPESPRCLIEALMSGVPLVGYRSAFAEELVHTDGGALLTAIGDPAALAQTLVELMRSQERREGLTWQAFHSGRHYSDVAVFEHRSALIRKHLSAPTS